MDITGSVALVFVALAVIFLALSLQDVLKAEERFTPALKTRLRIVIAFAAVGIGLAAYGILAR